MAYGYPENIFTGMIDEQGFIWEAGTGRKRQVIGIDAQKEQEYQQTISQMQETLDNYREKLIELGVIQVPKTPEELASEQLRIAQEQSEQQAEINKALLEAISGLQSQIKEMKNNGNVGSSSEFSGDADGQNSQDIGKVSTGNKRSDNTRKKGTSGNTE